VSAADYLPPEVLLGPERGANGASGSSPDLNPAAVDMWAVGCWFAEVLRGKPLFVGEFGAKIEVLLKIIEYVGCPTPDSWPGLKSRPGFILDFPSWRNHTSDTTTTSAVERFPREPDAALTQLLEEQRTPAEREEARAALSLLEGLLTLDPRRRITAAQALDHPFLHDLSKGAQAARYEGCGPVIRTLEPALPTVPQRGTKPADDAAQAPGTRVRDKPLAVPEPPGPQTRARHRTHAGRAAKRPAHGSDIDWAEGLPVEAWQHLGRALIQIDAQPLELFEKGETSREQARAVWSWRASRGKEWTDCSGAATDKLEDEWRKWRRAGCQVDSRRRNPDTGELSTISKAERYCSVAVKGVGTAAQEVNFAAMQAGSRAPISVSFPRVT